MEHNQIASLGLQASEAETGLKANHVCQAIRRVIGNAKAVKQVHKFRPTSINLDVRTFAYNEEKQVVGVTLISGRKLFKLSIGNYQVALLRGQKPTAATLNKTKKGLLHQYLRRPSDRANRQDPQGYRCRFG